MDNVAHLEVVEGCLVDAASHTELGIGTVLDLSNGDAQIRFYKRGGHNLTLPISSLQRHYYNQNEIVFSRTENAYGIVSSSRSTDARLTYQVIFGKKRKSIPESDIVPVPPATDPFDLLREEQIGDADHFLLAFYARRLQYAYSYDDLVSLSNARIDLLPHQVFVAHRVLGSYPHRFLLSDEVGLGKTIEAGLILKELRARNAARKVLIIAPSGLVPQWIDELSGKFNERFTRIDSLTYQTYAAQYGREQIWQSFDSIVTSLHFLRGNDDYIEQIAQQHWDLIIFDEAHHLRRYLDKGSSLKRSTTSAYRMAERLQASTTALLLLTATPLQLHSYELFSLVELLDPTLFPTFADFEAYRAYIPLLNSAASRLEQFPTLSTQARNELATDLASIFRAIGTYPDLTPQQALSRITASSDDRIRYQEDLSTAHRLTSVMLRNRKRQVFDDLQPRRAQMLRLEFTPAERLAYDAVTAYLQEEYNLALATNNQILGFLMVTYRKILTSSSYALRQSFQRRITKLVELNKANELLRRRTGDDILDDIDDQDLDELLDKYGEVVLDVSPTGVQHEVDRLLDLCELLEAIELDTKAERLLEALQTILSNPSEKVLIFTQFKETLSFLQGLLKPLYKVVTFYGGMNTIAKDSAVEQFRNPDGAQIMIATEAAGEGRNLQFCHIMFNYDLPFNPMKIEQRIGRLDRIGQKRPVQVYNFTVKDTLEDRVLQILQDRIHIFESTVGQLDPILEGLEQDVQSLLLSRSGHSEAELKAFDANITQRMTEAKKMESLLNDFLLDTRSFRRDRTDAILGRKPPFTGVDIQRFLSRFLTLTGGEMRERSAGVFELRVPRTLWVNNKAELKESYRATFDPAIAQQQERLDFVAFGHDLLDVAVDQCLDDDFGGRTANLLIRTDLIEPTKALCAVYEMSFTGIRPRRLLLLLAVSLAGDALSQLSELLPQLMQDAEDASALSVSTKEFESALDICNDALGTLRDQHLYDERLVRDAQNAQEYNAEKQKLERFYASRIESAHREIGRLQETLRDQESSTDASIRRILPATQGRIAAAERALHDIERERDSRISALEKQQSVTCSAELLSLAYITVESATEAN